MIPHFPVFKKLETKDKKKVEEFTVKFPPYSDFNFLSMWVWDIKGITRFCQLNGNLVVKFSDYLTEQPFYSFLGNNKVNDTAGELLELSEKEKITPILKLVPEDSIKNMDPNKFIINEERDHFDYIYAIEKIRTYAGNKHAKHRHMVNSFTKKHKFEPMILDLADESNQKILIDLLDLWVKNKREKTKQNQNSNDDDDFKNEYLALKRMFSTPKPLLSSVVCFTVFVDGVLSGFMIDEKTSKDYCISHFGKTNVSHKGNMQFLMQTSAKTFMDMGVKYYNDEQDLGLEGLRGTKSSYELAHFLKKYTVSLR